MLVHTCVVYGRCGHWKSGIVPGECGVGHKCRVGTSVDPARTSGKLRRELRQSFLVGRGGATVETGRERGQSEESVP